MKRMAFITAVIIISVLAGVFISMDLGLTARAAAQDAGTAQREQRDRLHQELLDYKQNPFDLFAKVAAMAQPSVVHIRVEKKVEPASNPFFDDRFEDFPFPQPRRRQQPEQQQEFKQQGEGSGMIVDAAGYVVTNNHVVDGSDSIIVGLFDGRQFKAQIVGQDPATDIALLKIVDEGVDLVPVIMGDSSAVRIGEWVIAIGNPLGLENTLTAGVVSAVGRSHVVPMQREMLRPDKPAYRDVYEDFIQTDAAINRGNSGGPLFNLRGEVVGMNTAIMTEGGYNAGSIGLGFAIPANMITYISGQLKAKGEVSRGWLGVIIKDLTPEEAQKAQIDIRREGSLNGVYVEQVLENSPAGDGGIQTGDIILKLNGNVMKNVTELRSTIAMTAVGATVKVTLLRGGETMTLDVMLGEREKALAVRDRETGTDTFGMKLEELTAEQAGRFGHDQPCVLVTGVEKESVAAKAGIEPYDIILKVGRTPVETKAAFAKEAGTFNVKEGIPLVVLDEKGQHAIELKE